jgi:hypothetical protein
VFPFLSLTGQTRGYLNPVFYKVLYVDTCKGVRASLKMLCSKSLTQFVNQERKMQLRF